MATSDKRHAELHAFDFSGIESKLDSSFACLNVIEKEVSIGLLPKYLGNENEFKDQVILYSLYYYSTSSSYTYIYC